MKHHDGMTEIERTASDAVSQLLEEYAATIGTASHEIEESVWQAAYRIAAVEIIPEADRPAGYATATDDDRATVSAMVEAIADRARETAALAHYQTAEAAAEAAAAPIYQRYELLAYLGEPEDYDVDAIEAEATRFTADGARVWAAFGEDLAAIAERHQLVTYWPAI